ncbi:propionyl-CoA carboxylase alpha chain [Saccharopolyspora erythraea NRRL 2338]|uniref:Acetyl/propionyl-CoA carboxylase alpha subunit n=4 Tax=Saccharopolyspora erythraea TaxID=1836 RepID=A4FEP2_SACEN|nr:biotin carboxylase N-terminal domain-containing protein [Saccharopolyspora erythraea]PFG96242.1 propionyl-CoA carboxylase alpha chain [Saccharopolyspora erythraea NRRL 2338]CAM02517.1 putative acetyl/propionyl-CoA carboxylase alpha subunit [Saccharopolyspora erythraea NRRL 2338]
MTSNPPDQIRRLLVANRGEIARRVLRTCRRLGISTVAVHSDADADAPHVVEADLAVRLPGDAAADTYLRGDLLVSAARATGADAVHPGYGFLSENAGFARAVVDAGLTWVGPPPEVIESMGSKVTAKRMMAEAGVPVLGELDPSEVTEADLPVLVKASAGGGGRGMRVVRALAELPAEIESASAEALSAFGDATVFCEPYLESGRHIEVQVMADVHGAVRAVGERECSIQRRHQKVVEEAPSPLVDEGMRERLFDAARAAAKAVSYVGAGTVELLATGDGRFFFLEMNTRLQVEHPVTECVTGIDLVASQLAVAEGQRLPDEPAPPRGHAVEVRLYAEDPAEDWRPQSGTLHRFELSDVDAEFDVPGTVGIRLDSGVLSGSHVGVHYDPMLAKVVSWAPTRAQAVRRLADSLARARIHGLKTNRDLLVRVLEHPAFRAGDTDTSFFTTHGLAELSRPLADERAEALSALAAALAEAAANRRDTAVAPGLPSGWRNVVSMPQTKRFAGPSGTHDVGYRLDRDGLRAEGFDDVTFVRAEPGRVVLAEAGVRRTFDIARYGSRVEVDSVSGPVALTRCERFPDPSADVPAGSLVAPMPGTVTRVAVAEGQQVRAGEPLLWMEAMKMEHRITAPADGTVAELPVSAGQQVEMGAVLAVVRTE